jgi:peroxiredoxin
MKAQVQGLKHHFFVMLLMISILFTQAIFAQTISKGGSELLTQSGEAKLGEKLPFFSGWDVFTNQVVTTKTMFKAGNQSKYIINLCASWCEPCKKGLKEIQGHWDQLKAKNIKVILLIANPKTEALNMLKELKLTEVTAIADEFNTHTKKYSPISENQQMTLPRSFVVDEKGNITQIIGAEGTDYIELLMK